MFRIILLLFAFSGCVFAVDEEHIKGLKKLLKGLDAGVFTTCNIVFFSELVRYEEADNNCKNFDIRSGRDEEGHLATVNDEEKNTDLKLLLETSSPDGLPCERTAG